MAASLINQASESDPLTPAEDIMVALFEWLFDISLAVAGATGRSMQMQRVDQV
jgi:hypothetical protein